MMDITQNDLIYFTVRGDEFKEMAAHCIRSLRSVGGFTGEIQVFTPSLNDHLRDVCHEANIIEHKFHNYIALDRYYAMDFIKSHRYSSILALDADILAMKNVSSLFSDTQEILYMEERWQTIADIPKDKTLYTYGMTIEECERYSSYHTINVGHFTIPGNMITRARKILNDLVQSYDEHIYGCDQAAFNIMIRRNLLPSRPYHINDVANATRTKEYDWINYSIIHFAGYPGRLEKIREWANKLCSHHDYQPIQTVARNQPLTNKSLCLQSKSYDIQPPPTLSVVLCASKGLENPWSLLRSLRVHIRKYEPSLNVTYHGLLNAGSITNITSQLSSKRFGFDMLTIVRSKIGLGASINHVISQVRSDYVLFLTDNLEYHNNSCIRFITESIRIMNKDARISCIKYDDDVSTLIQNISVHSGPFYSHQCGPRYYVQNPAVPEGWLWMFPSLIRTSSLRWLGPHPEVQSSTLMTDKKWTEQYSQRWVCAISPDMNIFLHHQS